MNIKLDKKVSDNLNNLNVSDKIRYLNMIGFKRSEISLILNKRYQHVRNVLVEDERLEKEFVEEYFENKRKTK